MGSHSVTFHPAAVTFPPLPQLKLVLDYYLYLLLFVDVIYLTDLMYVCFNLSIQSSALVA